MKSTGIMARLRSHYWYKPLEEESEPDFGVSLNAAFPIFMVFGLGAGISVFLLVVEICIYKMFNRQSKVTAHANAFKYYPGRI
jgi:hypothetical protein